MVAQDIVGAGAGDGTGTAATAGGDTGNDAKVSPGGQLGTFVAAENASAGDVDSYASRFTVVVSAGVAALIAAPGIAIALPGASRYIRDRVIASASSDASPRPVMAQ